VGPGRLWKSARNSANRSRRPLLRGSAEWPSPVAGAKLAGAACVALGVLVIAGCGSSSSNSEPGDSAFVASVNAACQAATAEAQALKKPNGPGSVAVYYARLGPIASTLLSKFNSTTPPPGKQEEYSRLVSLWRKEIALAAARSKAVKAGNQRESLTLDEEGHSGDTQFDAAANALGLNECSRNL